MNLYKVSDENSSYPTIKYILAVDKPTAISKYCELVPDYRQGAIFTRLLCTRDEIIPTVEPSKESIK